MTPKVLEAAACGNVLKSTPQVTLHVHMATLDVALLLTSL